jgi:hypothetical protein
VVALVCDFVVIEEALRGVGLQIEYARLSIMPTIMERQVAFSTPWFDVVGKRVGSDPSLYYALG